MNAILKLINEIRINNRKMKLSVLASSLVFYLILAIIPFFELLEYILNKFGIIEETISNVKEYSEFYKKIENSYLVKYEILENGISRSEFSNGAILYANNSDKAKESPAGILQSFEYALAVQWETGGDLIESN